MMRIIIDADKCAGCKNCSVACMKGHLPEGVEFSLTDNRIESRNTILLNGHKKYKPLFCRHCDKPKCVASCSSGAIVKDPGSGHIRYDPVKCSGCFMCVMNCPFGVLKPDRATHTSVIRCDFCTEHGADPRCVKACVKSAIRLEEVGK